MIFLKLLKEIEAATHDLDLPQLIDSGPPSRPTALGKY
jgi:hypothetical protein